MILEYRHNSAYDTILAVDASGVCSQWEVTLDELEEFCDCTNDPDNWDDQGGLEDEPEDFGELLAVRKGHGLSVIDEKRWEERLRFFAK